MRARYFFFPAALAASVCFAAAGGTCPSDVDGDGTVGVTDFLQVLSEWGCDTGCASDIDGDGVVGVTDFLQVLADWGCTVSEGTTTLSGTVVNLLTGDPVVDASVTVGDDVVFTDASGAYTGEFPVGTYDVLFEATYFLPFTENIELVEGVPATLDAQLEPESAVVVNVVALDDGEPGGMVDVTAEVIVLDGSTIESYAWTQTAGPAAAIDGQGTDTVTLTLGTQTAYKQRLVTVLAEPPIGPEDLPPNVPPPDEEFSAGLQNRFEVVGLNPFALEEAGLISLMADVTTTSGTYSGEGDVHTHLPWKPTAGIRNVPLDVPVLLHGKEQATYDWTLTRPNHSDAVLIDPGTRNPEFTPDFPGLYQLTVTDTAEGSPVTLQVFGGNWRGVIVGQDLDGRPIADSDCTGCHGNLGIDVFEPWAQTGHAEIFSDNLDTSTHYGEHCFACHTVGYDPGAFNQGFDDTDDYDAFIAAGLINNPGDNWTTMLNDFPESAMLANIQCENCHGPQWSFWGVNSGAHATAGPEGEPRVNISSNMCATCHGEPARHGRFQQWQLSAHANYALAIDESGSGNCSRCHTGNGFLAWLPVLLGNEPGDPTASIEVTWTADEVHPQTCTVCHDPHAIGTDSGEPNNATVRVAGDTPPLLGGFTAMDVGRGAICMTCHNSRRGLRNDSTFDDFYGTSEAARAPHGSSQADLLMGENAYLVTVGMPGGHSMVEDTCTRCHMVETPPPDDLSYNLSGTNHTFFASIGICAECHENLDGEALQADTQALLDQLQGAVEAALFAYIAEQTALGNIIDLDGDAQITDAASILEIEFGDYRGRQSMTLTFTDMSVLGPYRMSDVTILDPSMTVLGQFYDFADPNLIKAGWNWNLVHSDGSLGVHNPMFAEEILNASIDALTP